MFRAGQLAKVADPEITVYETEGPHIEIPQKENARAALEDKEPQSSKTGKNQRKKQRRAQAAVAQKTHAAHVCEKAPEIIGELRESPFGGGSMKTKSESTEMLKEKVPKVSPFGHWMPSVPVQANPTAGNHPGGVRRGITAGGEAEASEGDVKGWVSGVSPVTPTPETDTPWCPEDEKAAEESDEDEELRTLEAFAKGEETKVTAVQEKIEGAKGLLALCNGELA